MGSHLCGRVDHKFDGGQQGADVERVEHIKKRCPHMYINLQPGKLKPFNRFKSLSRCNLLCILFLYCCICVPSFFLCSWSS